MSQVPSSTAEKQLAWNILKGNIIDYCPISVPQKNVAEAELAAEILLSIYMQYASKRLSDLKENRASTQTQALGSSSIESEFKWENIQQFAMNFEKLMDGLNGASVSMEAGFCHSSCHSSAKGRSRR